MLNNRSDRFKHNCTIWQVINNILPVKARKEVDRLIAELQDGQFKLEFTPTTTLEFVESLNFLESIQERVSIPDCKTN